MFAIRSPFSLFSTGAFDRPRARREPPSLLARLFHRMLDLLMMVVLLLIALLIVTAPARACNTIFLTDKNGNMTFPFCPPNQSASTPGAIDNTTIGATTPAPGNFTTLTSTSAPSGAGITALFASPPPIGSTAQNTVGASQLKVDSGTKTATASAGAATLNKNAGTITTESLTTAGLADYTLTLTDSTILATDQIMWSVANGTNSAGDPVQGTATPSAGQVIFVVRNAHATAALNGTLKISFARLVN